MYQGIDRRSTGRATFGGVWRITASAALTLGLAASTALAVHPGHWVHSSEADYEPGAKENTIVTNLGDIKLAAQTQVIGKMPEDASVIYDLQSLAGGDLYIAAGPEGKLLRRKGDKIEQVVALKSEQVFALDVLDGKLLVAVSSSKSRLALLEDDKLVDLVALPEGVRYVWDIAVTEKAIYLATGTKGKILKVDRTAKDDKGQPKVTTLLETPQSNLLCLALDKQGRIFAGSDTDGLVYRVVDNANGKPESFVVFDAPEPEIGAIVATADGTIYIGTADADQSRLGRLEAAMAAESGRTEPDAAKPAKNPIEPPPAKPNPNEPPKPEPKHQSPAGTTNEPAAGSGGSGGTAGGNQNHVATELHPVTQEQQDQLREIIRQRLATAMRTGAMQAGPGGGPGAGSGPGAMERRIQMAQGGPGRPQNGGRPGNAVYRISPSGIVSEVYRESLMVLRMAEVDGKLLIATGGGNGGRVYTLDPAIDEHAVLIDLKPQQVSALLVGPNADVILGTSNPATLVSLTRDTANEGTYTSVVLDAGQISLWGKLNLTAVIPPGTTIRVETRSGNVQDPLKAPWSDWQAAADLNPKDNNQPLAPMETSIVSPPARFLQYRLTLAHHGVDSPVAHKVEITFVVPNMKPVIRAIQAGYPGTPPPTPSGNPANPQPMPRALPPRPAGPGAPDAGPVTTMNIEWEAADPNGDQLVYTLEYKPAGADRWLPLAKDLKENHYEWQTRRVPDGRYILRVIASDLPDNTPDMALTTTRDSDPVLVDNTPPALTANAAPGKGNAVISGSAKDELSMIQSIYYAVDSAEQWQYVLPANGIYDSTSEDFQFTIPDLASGQHVVTVRATDARGNVQSKSMIVEIK